ALPARNTNIFGTQPASRAVTRTEAPSATNSPVSRRTLRISSERMSFTRSFCRLVMARVAPRRGSGGIARGPACVVRGRQQPPTRLLDHRQLAALGRALAADQALAHERVGGERGGADRIGREHQRRAPRTEQG